MRKGITIKEDFNTKIMKYAVSFMTYERYGGSEGCCKVIEASSDKEGLMLAEDNFGYGKFYGEIEEGERTLDSISLKEVKEYLESNNGDGCEYIISVINLTTGEIIFS